MTVAWWGLIPFATLLASIAVLPLLPATAERWADPRAQLALALSLGGPVAAWFVAAGEPGAVGHALLEYAQFITLLFSLYVVTGGIHVAGDLRADPRTNMTFLAVGGLLASFIGTTGAAMLLIRPLVNTNAERRHRAHTVVFTIFVVANCGGLLTPLGDPPLFLGLLRGVPFTWTLSLLPPWAFTNGMLLLGYYALERRLYAAEPAEAIALDDRRVQPLRLHGGGNLLLLALVVAAVAAVPSVDVHALQAGHASAASLVPWRELVLLGAAAASYRFGDRQVRYVRNGFTWAAILEVGALFVGIFLTMMPALRYLAQVAPGVHLDELRFFAYTGSLSAVLDNAPTYATFFEMAAALPGEPRVAGVPEHYLVAISLGAVMCGAMTYIGNGPNFMVKSIAESAGVSMPSFGGYVGWSLRHLLPVLVAMALLFIATGAAARIAGAAITLSLLVHAAWSIARPVSAGARAGIGE